jgi:carbon-monoxide dehydrogenase medium subunit
LGSDAIVLAGGTDVMVQLQRAELKGTVLLNIEHVDAWRTCDVGAGSLIGALVTQRMLAEDRHVQARHGALAAAARLCGGWQTQSVGTIAGNVCNASPGADLTPALLVYGTQVVLESERGGTRTVPLEEFVVGRRQVARKPDEIVTRFELDKPPPRTADAFEKVGRRGAMEISIVNVAARLSLSPDDKVADARIAVGSVGPKAFRATHAEQILEGQPLTDNVIGAAARASLVAATPIDDVRASRAYRLAVLPRVVERVLRQCRHKIGICTNSSGQA